MLLEAVTARKILKTSWLLALEVRWSVEWLVRLELLLRLEHPQAGGECTVEGLFLVFLFVFFEGSLFCDSLAACRTAEILWFVDCPPVCFEAKIARKVLKTPGLITEMR